MKFRICYQAVNVDFQTAASSIIGQNITVWKLMVIIVIRFVQLIV